MRQLKAAVGAPHDAIVHFGATSQDVIDTGLVLRLRQVIDHLDLLLTENILRLTALEERFGDKAFTGMTRMQPAISIRVSDRVTAWRAPLQRHRERLSEQSARLLVVQFGGAAGTLESLATGAAVRRACRQARPDDAPQWHSQRDA